MPLRGGFAKFQRLRAIVELRISGSHHFISSPGSCAAPGRKRCSEWIHNVQFLRKEGSEASGSESVGAGVSRRAQGESAGPEAGPAGLGGSPPLGAGPWSWDSREALLCSTWLHL